jgi:hypothetical protein
MNTWWSGFAFLLLPVAETFCFPTPSPTITSTFSAATQMTVVCLQLEAEAGTGAYERLERSGARRENELSRSGSSSTQLRMGEVKSQIKRTGAPDRSVGVRVSPVQSPPRARVRPVARQGLRAPGPSISVSLHE